MATINLSSMTDIIFNGVELTEVLFKQGTAAAVSVWKKITSIGLIPQFVGLTGTNSPTLERDNKKWSGSGYRYNNDAAYSAANAFDNTDTTMWASRNSTTASDTLSMTFSETAYIDYVEYRPYKTNGSAIGSYTVYNNTSELLLILNFNYVDGTNSHAELEYTTAELNSNATKQFVNDYPDKPVSSIVFSNGRDYQSFASATLYNASNKNYILTCGKLQAYGRYAAGDLTPLIPIMTSDSMLSSDISATASVSGRLSSSYPAYYSFDKTNTNGWVSANVAGTSSWLQCKLESPMTVNKIIYKIIPAETFDFPNGHDCTIYFNLLNSSDGIIKTVSKSLTAQQIMDREVVILDIGTVSNCYGVKLTFSSHMHDQKNYTSRTLVSCGELQLYGSYQ